MEICGSQQTMVSASLIQRPANGVRSSVLLKNRRQTRVTSSLPSAKYLPAQSGQEDIPPEYTK